MLACLRLTFSSRANAWSTRGRSPSVTRDQPKLNTKNISPPSNPAGLGGGVAVYVCVCVCVCLTPCCVGWLVCCGRWAHPRRGRESRERGRARWRGRDPTRVCLVCGGGSVGACVGDRVSGAASGASAHVCGHRRGPSRPRCATWRSVAVSGDGTGKFRQALRGFLRGLIQGEGDRKKYATQVLMSTNSRGDDDGLAAGCTCDGRTTRPRWFTHHSSNASHVDRS